MVKMEKDILKERMIKGCDRPWSVAWSHGWVRRAIYTTYIYKRGRTPSYAEVSVVRQLTHDDYSPRTKRGHQPIA